MSKPDSKSPKNNFNGTQAVTADFAMIADFVKIPAWNKLIDGPVRQPGIVTTVDQTIPSNLADPCTARYQQVYANPRVPANLDIIDSAFTFSMAFGSKSLSDWALDISNNTNAVQIEVRLGLYFGDIVIRYGLKQDRLTAFLYPIDGTGNLAKYLVRTPGAPGTPATMTTGADAPTFDLAGLKP